MNNNEEKRFIFTLLDGTNVEIKGYNYDDLLCNIDEFILKYNECITYYAGYDDNVVVELAQDDDIDAKIVEE